MGRWQIDVVLVGCGVVGLVQVGVDGIWVLQEYNVGVVGIGNGRSCYHSPQSALR